MISFFTPWQRLCWLQLGFWSLSTIILLLGLLPGDDDYDDDDGDDDGSDNNDDDDNNDKDDGDNGEEFEYNKKYDVGIYWLIHTGEECEE